MNSNDLYTLEDNIVNSIFDAIFTKKLHPGIKLSESVLAKELNTSRDVLRKAFSKLQTMGILTYKKNQGFNVVWLSEENARDIYAARKVIEAGVVEIVTKKVSTQNLDLSILSENTDNEEYLKVSLRNGEYVKTSCDFHLNLAILSDNELSGKGGLGQIIEKLFSFYNIPLKEEEEIRRIIAYAKTPSIVKDEFENTKKYLKKVESELERLKTNESEFDFLDRCAWPKAQHMRSLLEQCLNNYPVIEQPEIIARLKSGDPRQFTSTTFELLLHQYLINQKQSHQYKLNTYA